MGGNRYKILLLVLVFSMLFSFSVSAEWRHPDCPEDFEGYKEEYGIPKWEFKDLFKECYIPQEVYEFRKARDADYEARTHYANESEEYRKKTEEVKKKIAEWAKNPPPKPEGYNSINYIPEDLPPPPGSNVSEFGKKIKSEDFKARVIKNKNKIWWLNIFWKEEINNEDESSTYYKIKNYKNKLVVKLKFWKNLYKNDKK